MLEIFILFALGRAINRKATEKGWPGWPFVLILLFLYIGGAITGVVAALIVSGGLAANGDDDLLPFLLGYLGGAATGALASYLIAAALPDRSEPDRENDRRRRARDREDDDYEDDRPLPKARRADDEDDGWRRRES
jgi:hypothetical protein